MEPWLLITLCPGDMLDDEGAHIWSPISPPHFLPLGVIEWPLLLCAQKS